MSCLQRPLPDIYSTCVNNSPAKQLKKNRKKCRAPSPQPCGSQLSAKLLLGCLWTLGTILGAALCTVGNTGGIQRTTNDVIAHTGKVLHTTTTNKNDTVLLQVVAFSRDVGVDFLLVCQTNTGNLTHCRIRLLGSCRIDTNADATTLRT